MSDIESGSLVAANDNDEYRFYVYAWLYPDGRPFYVGKGCGKRDIRTKEHNPIFRHITAKIRRGGEKPRVVRWHEWLREEDAHRLETAYIRLFGRRDNCTGILCNLTDGGDGTSNPSDETRAKLSRATSGENNPNFGRSPSAETRAKIGDKNRGRTHSAEARAKMSADRKGRAISAEQREKLRIASTGKTHSVEVREKMSKAKKGKPGRPRTDEERVKLITAVRFAPPRNDYKGVSFHKATGKWRCRLRLNGGYGYIGVFSDPTEAARAYDAAAIEAWGLGNCYLNFPEEIDTKEASS